MKHRPASTANLLCALATAVGDLLTSRIDDVESLGVSAATALLSIGTRPGTCIGELGEVIQREHSTTVRIVDRLECASLVKRSPTEEDARRIQLLLTADGQQAFERILARRDELLDEVLKGLDEPSREDLHSLLDRLLETMADTQERARSICRWCDHRICQDVTCPVGRPFY